MKMRFSHFFLAAFAWFSLLSSNLSAQDRPEDFIADQAGMIPKTEALFLSAKLKVIAESDSLAIYFVSYKVRPDRQKEDPVVELTNRWIGGNLGAIVFVDASGRFLLKMSNGLIKALGNDRIRRIGETLNSQRESQQSIVQWVELIARTLQSGVKDARAEAAGDQAENSVEWNPTLQAWSRRLEDRLEKMDQPTVKADEPARASPAAGDESDQSTTQRVAEATAKSGVLKLPWIPICVATVVLALVVFGLVRLFQSERTFAKEYPVPEVRERIEPRFGALCSGGHGATLDLSKEED